MYTIYVYADLHAHVYVCIYTHTDMCNNAYMIQIVVHSTWYILVTVAITTRVTAIILGLECPDAILSQRSGRPWQHFPRVNAYFRTPFEDLL